MSYGGTNSSGSIHGSNDVALSNPAASQVLAYNASLQKWQNQPFQAGIYDITDVKYGGAGLGSVSQDTAAFAAATADMITAGGGVVYFPAGSYHISSFPDLTPPAPSGPMPYAIRGAGAQVSIIYSHATSASASLTVSNPAFTASASSSGVPQWGGFTLNGANSSGGASGIIWGDVGGVHFQDIDVSGFTTGDAMYFYNGYGWCEKVIMTKISLGNSANLLRFGVGLGRQLAELATTVNSGDTITSLQLSTGLPQGVSGGAQIVLYSGSGSGTKTVTVDSAGASAGATTVPIVSTTADTTYAAGTASLNVGSYGSFDYWTVNSLNFGLHANQNGLVSEVPMGLGAAIARVGSTIRITGNAQMAPTNSGKIFWIKGNDSLDAVWDVALEGDGSGTSYIPVQFDTGAGGITGSGRFHIMGISANSIFTGGGSYQFQVVGSVILPGITQAGSSYRGVRMQNPVMRYIPNNPTSYVSSAIVSGSPWQNTLYTDYLVTVPVTFTANGTVSWSVNTYTGLPAGSVSLPGLAGQTVPVTFVHYGRHWARIDVTNANIGSPIYQYI